MRLRSALAISGIALGALVLSSCNLLPPAPEPSDEPTVTATPSETPVDEPDPLPADAVLSLSLRATSDTGAAVDILLVLLKPEPFGSDAGVPRAAATVDHCPDEVDQTAIELDSGYSFGELDVTVTPVEGTSVWPADLPLHLFPGEGDGASLAAGGAAYQVERPNELGEDGFYVPNCAQDAFLGVPGTGSVYLGWYDDASSLTAWLGTNYGATFDAWGEPINEDQAILSDCTTTITDLGVSMGATEGTFIDFFSDTQCIVVSSANTP